ncbi:hypothetical protein C8R47DRAFT_1118240 [Mycena vitilis]|nr:hypothetical protein C8R47DRAFT_1118240 [Mycena vitilis]
MFSSDAGQLENAYALLKHLNAQDWVSMRALLADGFKHQYLPSTINPPDGKDERGPDEFIAAVKFYMDNLFNKITYGPPLDVIQGADKVVFHMKSAGSSKSGKPYNNEYMITFHFVGDRIARLNEFVDSKYSATFFAGLRDEASDSKASA